MVSLTLSVPADLRKRMQRHPQIRWSAMVRSILEQQVDELEEAERIASKSRLSQKDVKELSEKVDAGVSRRWEEAKA